MKRLHAVKFTDAQLVIFREYSKIRNRAQDALTRALKSGEIKRSDKCEDCGRGCEELSHFRKRLHGHHDDYTKPLDVRWLCSKCHTKWHLINGDIRNRVIEDAAKYNFSQK